MRVAKKAKVALLLITIIIASGSMGILSDATTLIEAKNTRSKVATDHIVINELYYNVTDKKNEQWFELYNPTDSSVNISGWVIHFYNVEGVIVVQSNTIMNPEDYIVVCDNLSAFYNSWSVPDGTKVFESSNIAAEENSNLTLYEEYGWTPVIVDILDYGGKGVAKAPPVPINHSIAMYTGGWDTDNCSNDFYDEFYPTPGRENVRSKHSPIAMITSPADGSMYLTTDSIFFDGSNSSDTDSDALSLSWYSNISGFLEDISNFSMTLEAGHHQITLWVNDSHGHNVSAAVNIIVKTPNQKPMVAISTPSDGSTVKGKIVIAGAANDPDGVVVSVWIRINNENWMETDGTWSWSYTWDTTKVSNDGHTISVRAYDGYNYSAIKTITVNVDNEKETPKGFIPSFEALTLIAMLGVCVVLLRKRKR